MPDDQVNVPVEERISKPTPEMEKRWAEAAELQKQDKIAQGHADDGTYILVETDLTTGMQTVVCAPHDNNEILKFVHPLTALGWVEEWGEEGFGYLVFKAVDGRNGAHALTI